MEGQISLRKAFNDKRDEIVARYHAKYPIMHNEPAEEYELFCVCHKVIESSDQLLECCNGGECLARLFHPRCMGLATLPKIKHGVGKSLSLFYIRALIDTLQGWYCPRCQVEGIGKLRPAARVQETNRIEDLQNGDTLWASPISTPGAMAASTPGQTAPFSLSPAPAQIRFTTPSVSHLLPSSLSVLALRVSRPRQPSLSGSEMMMSPAPAPAPATPRLPTNTPAMLMMPASSLVSTNANKRLSFTAPLLSPRTVTDRANMALSSNNRPLSAELNKAFNEHTGVIADYNMGNVETAKDEVQLQQQAVGGLGTGRADEAAKQKAARKAARKATRARARASAPKKFAYRDDGGLDAPTAADEAQLSIEESTSVFETPGSGEDSPSEKRMFNSATGAWKKEEDDVLIEVIRELTNGGLFGEKVWRKAGPIFRKRCSTRPINGIKMRWCRVLRAQSGIDERRRKSDKLLTSVQTSTAKGAKGVGRGKSTQYGKAARAKLEEEKLLRGEADKKEDGSDAKIMALEQQMAAMNQQMLDIVKERDGTESRLVADPDEPRTAMKFVAFDPAVLAKKSSIRASTTPAPESETLSSSAPRRRSASSGGRRSAAAAASPSVVASASASATSPLSRREAAVAATLAEMANFAAASRAAPGTDAE